MNCIFCKHNSLLSCSIEHIVPESLGNKKLILPAGAVCDSCNQYFATHLEKKILESHEFSYLRFNQSIKNKRGRIPEVAILFGDQIVKARRVGTREFAFNSSDFEKIEEFLSNSDGGKMMIPVTGKSPSDLLVSRWLAKMALEMFVYKCIRIEGWNKYFVEHEGLDLIRRYARAPKKGEVWKYSKRRIYDENALIETPEGVSQMIYECDILVTGDIDATEFYFVVAIFGVEYAINLGGNSMDGYQNWLDRNNGISPLYISKKTARSKLQPNISDDKFQCY